ncbi:hypothetical protein Tcan_07198 [Toxocara canis]|uniref:Uncharacterized protein n=1 Tax=Toxocara canis TaxID=6265 RepID=A0A0B2VK06_TOXCA|nr:hypothetical protein Tcan_07198 [Toxocara canis]
MRSSGLHRTVLAVSICLILCGLCLTTISLFSAAWQVVEIREFQAEHQHGIWWDCVRSDRYLIPLSRIDRGNESPRRALKCAYKFDLVAQEALADALADGEATAKEMQLHRFLPSCSALADVIFLFAAMRIDTRFVHGIVDVYEQRIGYAAILHLLATTTFLLSLLSSLLAAYLLISARGASECCCFVTEYQYDYRQEPYARCRVRSECGGAPLLSPNGGATLRKCDSERCRPFVVMTDETST